MGAEGLLIPLTLTSLFCLALWLKRRLGLVIDEVQPLPQMARRQSATTIA